MGAVGVVRTTRRSNRTRPRAREDADDPHRIREEFFEELRRVYSESEIVELLLFAGLEVGLDRFCVALELDTTDRSPYPDDLEYPLTDPRPDQHGSRE